MYDELSRLALAEFADVGIHAETVGRRAAIPLQMPLIVRDGTLIDVWLSPDLARYFYHWEQRAKRGLIYRPDVSTFPKHLHNVAGSFPLDDAAALFHILDDLVSEVYLLRIYRMGQRQ